jgi:hypothetical protein
MQAGGRRVCSIPAAPGFGDKNFSSRPTPYVEDKSGVVPANSDLEYDVGTCSESLSRRRSRLITTYGIDALLLHRTMTKLSTVNHGQHSTRINVGVSGLYNPKPRNKLTAGNSQT